MTSVLFNYASRGLFALTDYTGQHCAAFEGMLDHLMELHKMGRLQWLARTTGRTDDSIITMDPDPEEVLVGGKTMLHLAALNGQLAVVNWLCEQATKSGLGREMMDAKDDKGQTPLHLAALFGQLDIVKKLLENGADIDAQSNDGSTALHFCAEDGYLEVAQFLIESHANMALKTNEGKSVLDVALYNGFENFKEVFNLSAIE